MPYVQKTKFVPVPEGIYNMIIDQFEEVENTNQKGQFYYRWTIRVLDRISDYPGEGKFSVNTPKVLTEKNAFSKFLAKIGIGEIPDGGGIELDKLIGHKFIGKVIVLTRNEKRVNDLGNLTLQEFQMITNQGGTGRPTTANKPQAAPAGVAHGVQQQPVQRPQSQPAYVPQQQQQSKTVHMPAIAQPERTSEEVPQDSGNFSFSSTDGFPE